MILLSHAHELAAGLARLAAQMAQDVEIVPLGGMPAGSEGLGTDAQALCEATTELLTRNQQVVIIADLGSAVLTAEAVLEMYADEYAGRVNRAPGPFVEGAVAGIVRAQTGGDAGEVCQAVAEASALWSNTGAEQSSAPASGETRRVKLGNSLGLHARPAAILARMVAEYDARVTINGADAASILALMKLGIAGGEEVEISAQGPQAELALEEVSAKFADGFGEQ